MDSSPLANLPAELRNHIYELVLASDKQFKIIYSPRFRFYSKLFLVSDQPDPLALTETCKAIRAEATQLFYAINTFAMPFATIHDFAHDIGPNHAAALRHVVLGLASWSMGNRATRKSHAESLVRWRRELSKNNVFKMLPRCKIFVAVSIRSYEEDDEWWWSTAAHEIDMRKIVKSLRSYAELICEGKIVGTENPSKSLSFRARKVLGSDEASWFTDMAREVEHQLVPRKKRL